LAHPLARLDADVGPVVQDPGDRRDRDTCLLGDVAYGGAPAHGLLTNSGSGSQRLAAAAASPPYNRGGLWNPRRWLVWRGLTAFRLPRSSPTGFSRTSRRSSTASAMRSSSSSPLSC